MRELVFETNAADTDEISDALIDLGALSVTVGDAHSNALAEQPIFGEPGMPLDIQAWPRSKVIVLLDGTTDPTDLWQRFCSEDERFTTAIVEIRELCDQDWVAETQRQFSPLTIGSRLWVGPHWATPDAGLAADALVIRLDPGMAFGTGSHATTQLCLEQLIHAIDRRRHERLRVLDMGCGSGILAISCKKLGADDVLAVDIDPIAVTATRDNAMANQAEIATQAAAEPIVGLFDIVVANILSQPLKVLAPALARLVRPKGSLLLSGILARQAEEILETYRPIAQHLNPLGVLQERDGWVCIGTCE